MTDFYGEARQLLINVRGHGMKRGRAYRFGMIISILTNAPRMLKMVIRQVIITTNLKKILR